MVAVSDMSEAFGVIDEISKLSGNAAIERLSQHSNDPLLQQILQYAYDPFKVYGIKKIPEPIAVSFDHDWPWVRETLNDLAAGRVTGHRARDMVAGTLGGLNFSQRELFKRILKKDLRFGLSAKKINKALPGLIPIFEPMLAKPYESGAVKTWPVSVEPKLDGVRVFAIVDLEKATVEFKSRKGKQFTSFDHLKGRIGMFVDHLIDANDAHQVNCVVLDGEVTSGSFLDTVSSVRRKNQDATDAVFNVFDVLTSYEFFDLGRSIEGHATRRAQLAHLDLIYGDGIELVDSSLAYCEQDIEVLTQRIWDAGGEGVIVKDRAGQYECKRSSNWLKIKAEVTDEFKVVGAYEGEGKYAGMLGGLVVERTTDEGKVVYPRVGGGFSDDQRDEFWNAYFADLRSHPVLNGQPGNVLNRTIEAEYHEITPDGSLRHARFKRFRDSLTGDKE